MNQFSITYSEIEWLKQHAERDGGIHISKLHSKLLLQLLEQSVQCIKDEPPPAPEAEREIIRDELAEVLYRSHCISAGVKPAWLHTTPVIQGYWKATADAAIAYFRERVGSDYAKAVLEPSPPQQQRASEEKIIERISAMISRTTSENYPTPWNPDKLAKQIFDCVRSEQPGVELPTRDKLELAKWLANAADPKWPWERYRGDEQRDFLNQAAALLSLSQPNGGGR